MVFASNGDPIIASFRTIKRIRATDGTTAWTANRLGSVSGNCGGALGATGFYVADAAAGGNVIKKFNIDTGAFMYQSPVLASFLIPEHPDGFPRWQQSTSRVSRTTRLSTFSSPSTTTAAP